MEAYSKIAERGDLFREHEVSVMYRDALDTFEGVNPRGSYYTKYKAAAILAKGYDDIGDAARAELKGVLVLKQNEIQRGHFSAAILECNPSLLKDDSLRLLVRETLNDLEDPSEALSQLASYIDKNSLDDTNFIIEQSLARFGRSTSIGVDHGLNAPALAIAKVFDGEVSPQHKTYVKNLIASGTDKGLALASAFKKLERPAEAIAKSGMRESAKLLREMVTVVGNTSRNPLAAIENVGKIAKTAERQGNAARKALMVCDRDDRGR